MSWQKYHRMNNKSDIAKSFFLILTYYLNFNREKMLPHKQNKQL